MPFLHIRLAGRDLTDSERLHLQDEATRLAVTILGKRADVTAVLVEGSPIANWTVGVRPQKMAGHFEILISEGTNTAGEKDRFIAAAYGLLQEVLGAPLNAATYVVIREIPMENWGYGGRTQESRRIAVAA
ncbi:tautomerase family protein [Shinella sp. CPCC 101442]|uniref:tautomerase family protein n=1 Tax=Shinella sp. CPCC 101442 TaxID=2932265 RepID=UPI002152BA70|nr:tautomerase family protein [Shinella sp. CPCC 101442]MCR6500258.1 tautomerase family protein [Shinella sp. CPCC 101442]